MDCQLKRMPWIDRCVNYRQALLRPILGRMLDLLLPEHCCQCGARCHDGGYCVDCATTLRQHENQCRICAAPFTGDGICGRCQVHPLPVTETIAPFVYGPPISGDIHKLKYQGKLAYGRDLGLLLAAEVELRASLRPDVLVPVPLHWKRRFRRGFNQSAEIARPVSRRLGIPMDPALVRRRLHTASQVGLSPGQRRRNLRGAFQHTGASPPSSVAIIDDVITSGATVAEVANCLRLAGVNQIVVWALTHA